MSYSIDEMHQKDRIKTQEINLLVKENRKLREALNRVIETLSVPAAEYVPAIPDAILIIQEALK